MSIHNICFHGGIRKILELFDGIKSLSVWAPLVILTMSLQSDLSLFASEA